MACPGSMGKETRIEAGGDEAAGRQGSSEDRTRTTPQGQQQGDLNSSPEMAKIQKLGVTMHAPAPCRSQYCGFYSGCLDSALHLGTARTFETTVLRLVDFRPRQEFLETVRPAGGGSRIGGGQAQRAASARWPCRFPWRGAARGVAR
ncbi:hypothetical protein SEVIR_4G213900v4 [Setaria viridis]